MYDLSLLLGGTLIEDNKVVILTELILLIGLLPAK